MQYMNMGILLQSTFPAEIGQIWREVTHSEYILIAMHLAHMRMQPMNCWFAVILCNVVIKFFLRLFYFLRKASFIV